MGIGLILLIIFLIPALILLIAGLIDWVLSLICIPGVGCLGDLLHMALGGKTLPAWLWEQVLYAGFVGADPKHPAFLTIYWWVNMLTGIVKALAGKITETLAAVNIVIDPWVAQVIAIAIIMTGIALSVYVMWRVIV